MNVQAIIKRLEAVGKRADAAALREVAALYRTVSLADLIALVQVGLDRTSPRLRLAQLDSLMGAFDQAAVNLGTPPASVLSQIEGVITANVTAAGDMLAAGGIVDAFRVQPAMQLEWAETAAERMKRYWLTETARTRGEVQAALVEGLTRGQSSQQVAQNIRGRLGVSRSRSNVIARNELGNAASYAMQTSQTLAGVTQYIWSTASDDRVRPEHAARDGQVFKWDDPPYDGAPGEAVLCRCVAIAVIE